MLFSAPTYEITAQVIGFVAAFIGICAYSLKDDRRLKFMMGTQNAIVCFHFIMLSAFSAAGVTAVASLRNFMSLKAEMRRFLPFFLIIYILIGVLNYQAWYSVLPAVASCISSAAYFLLKGLRMRFILFVGSVLWFTHNLIIWSIGPMIMEVFLMGALVFSMFKIKKAPSV